MMPTLLETEKKEKVIIKPEPFLKWAGGKSQLLKQFFLNFFPLKLN